MTGGMKIAGAAMQNFAARHDVVSHNLANVSTPGFARQDTVIRKSTEGDPFEIPQVSTRTDFTAGPPIITDNPLDLRLTGSGFFTVQSEGGERYTRNAQLRPDAEGFLRTPDGEPVLGERGMLYVGKGELVIERDGSILVDGSHLDRLKIATFRSGDDLKREAGNLYAVRSGHKADPTMVRPEVVPGQIEGSSVQPIGELVKMIEAMRSYEAAVSALRATDSTVDKAVNSVARVY